MFDFLFRLFGRKTQIKSALEPENYQRKDSTPPPLSSGIRYDNTLIDKLKSDHVELLRLFGEIKTNAEQRNYIALPNVLASFRTALQTHLMLENVKFYAYAQQHLEKDSDTSRFIGGIKREMDTIVLTVMRFLKTYETEKSITEKPGDFIEELGTIGNALIKRINLEETRLYTLYMPSY